MGLTQFIAYLLEVLAWLIIARALVSWFPSARNNPIVQVLFQITDPIMVPIQKVMPRMGMFDFSPLVAVIVLMLLSSAITRA